MTGLEWLREAGTLTTPIAITNTHSVGVVRDAFIGYEAEMRAAAGYHGSWWSLPVVAETYDGGLNDINGMHVRPEHVRRRWRRLRPVPSPRATSAVGPG